MVSGHFCFISEPQDRPESSYFTAYSNGNFHLMDHTSDPSLLFRGGENAESIVALPRSP